VLTTIATEQVRMKTALVVAGLLLTPILASAEDLESTHLFGFTLGTDVNKVGEVEGELETVGRFAKHGGSYTALSPTAGIKFIPFENFSIEPGAGLAYHNISGVQGLDDRRQWAFDTLSLELRYRVLDREHAPFGLTFGADPHWGRVDDISGEPVDRFGADFLMALDRELVANRIFAAFNLIYQPDAARSRVTGAWEHQSNLGISGALTAQVQPGVLIGAEARFMRSFDGLGLDVFTGQAFFIGPTLYAKFNERIWMSAAWSVQVAGHASNEPGLLDLTNFERHQAVLRFGYNF
jgi:hypothetical protein